MATKRQRIIVFIDFYLKCKRKKDNSQPVDLIWASFDMVKSLPDMTARYFVAGWYYLPATWYFRPDLILMSTWLDMKIDLAWYETTSADNCVVTTRLTSDIFRASYSQTRLIFAEGDNQLPIIIGHAIVMEISIHNVLIISASRPGPTPCVIQLCH